MAGKDFSALVLKLALQAQQHEVEKEPPEPTFDLTPLTERLDQMAAYLATMSKHPRSVVA